MARSSGPFWAVEFCLHAIPTVVRVGAVAPLARCDRLWSRGKIRCVDCSHIKVHRDAANTIGGQANQAMGRTKGGLNTSLQP